MDYCFEVCDVFSNLKSKSKHFKTKNHKNLDKHRHIKLPIDYPNIDDIDKIIYIYNNEFDNNYEYYLVRCKFKICFMNMEGYPVASSKLKINGTMVSWKTFV